MEIRIIPVSMAHDNSSSIGGTSAAQFIIFTVATYQHIKTYAEVAIGILMRANGTTAFIALTL
jgi:hypothetical protein